MPKKKAKNRQGIGEDTKGTISRRNVLKIGAAAGAATVLAPNVLTSNNALAFQGPVTEPVICVTPATVHHIIPSWMNSQPHFLRSITR